MSARSDVPPDTIQVSLEPEGVEVTYTDGRSVFYHGVPAVREGELVAAPGKEVHVLVTDPTESEGVLVYVNDRRTHDDVLESTGVGRVIVERGESTSLFPGVEAENLGYRVRVSADPAVAGGRVFVFVEDAVSEGSFELVGPDSGRGPDESAGADGATADEDWTTVDADGATGGADESSDGSTGGGD